MRLIVLDAIGPERRKLGIVKPNLVSGKWALTLCLYWDKINPGQIYWSELTLGGAPGLPHMPPKYVPGKKSGDDGRATFTFNVKSRTLLPAPPSSDISRSSSQGAPAR